MHEDLHSHKQSHSSGAGEAAQMVKDPVCGMNVDQSSAKHSAEFGGQKYYFCSPRCKSKFLEGPRRFLSAKHETPSHQVAHAEGRTIYTCPMHPEVRQTGPGSCPICGMALEPEVIGAEAGANPELANMTRRFWIGLVLTVPVIVLEMGGHLLSLHAKIGQQTSNWTQFILSTPVVL